MFTTRSAGPLTTALLAEDGTTIAEATARPGAYGGGYVVHLTAEGREAAALYGSTRETFYAPSIAEAERTLASVFA